MISEEEKKAIETLEIEGTENNYLEVKILLNLVEKQQKEIEDMEEELQMYVDTNLMKNKLEEKISQQEEEIKKQQKEIEEWRNGIRINDKVSIPKDKIRAKREQYLAYDKEVKSYTYDGRENITFEWYKARALEELLEEK